MKVGIAFRFGLLLAMTGVFASGLTGYYAYNDSRDLLLRAAEERLLTATRALASQFLTGLENSALDAQLLAGDPRAAVALLSAPGPTRNKAEDDLAALFCEMLKTRPAYFQVRLIDADNHGIERVRIDRDISGLLRIRGDELQEKGHLPYVFDTLQLSPGTAHFSKPVINREIGAHAGEGKPSLHLSVPVYGNSKTPLGLIVINVDLGGKFKQLTAELPSEIGLYLANRSGDFLVHPDSSRAFAFDQGRRALVQDEFPATSVLFNDHKLQVVPTVKLAQRQGEGVVSAFVKQPLNTPQQDVFFVLGLSQPLADVLHDSDALGRAVLKIVLAFSALSVVLATLLARALTQPLKQILTAVNRFAIKHEQMPLPIKRSDEIGLLARGFENMRQQIEGQMGALQEKQRELDHLASHDTLTGLPNRRMFLDRLEHALARARRNDEPVAVLFIDLDKFKDINDSLGHATGDIVLRTTAQRMLSVIREADTVARIGGDEFVILLDGIVSKADTALVAAKVIETLGQPVEQDGHSLHIGASIGIACYPQDGSTGDELLGRADQAMYEAKCTGRNRYVFAS